jgi:hypothetical protein
MASPFTTELSPEAKEKKRAYERAYYRANSQKHMARTSADRLKREFGITLVCYLAMTHLQDGKCAVCRKTPGQTSKPGMRLVVDHSHDTGKIRGLLCYNCNLLLGHARDNQDVLRSAMNYLESQ